MQVDLPFTRKDAAADDGALPELLKLNDGTPVTDAAGWRLRRKEILDLIIPMEYGGMPPALAPEQTTAELISSADAARRFGGTETRVFAYKVHVAGGLTPLDFMLTLWLPAGEGPFPVIVNGDGCWSYLNDASAGELLRRGFAVASFNRCEVARDWNNARDCGIYTAFPGEYGALSAWAWAYHRVYDALLSIPEIDSAKFVITGHSRGGKTVELAAATDERIAAVGGNNSGCGGFGCFRVRGKGCERIADITRYFPFWFDKDFASWAGREGELPFDQHFLCALIAPRPHLIAVAFDDTWSNPVGACEIYRGTVDVYKLLGAEDNLGIVFREGGHAHEVGDWIRFADFAKARM